MAGIVVKPRARILHGHDWVFSGEVLKVFGQPADGDVISLKDGRDHLIGSAIYNSKSQIVARRFSRRRQDLDLDFFQRRIAQAIEYRARRGVNPRLCRMVWSESDGLPGVIVDRYGDVLVLQTLTLAMDMRKALIVEALATAGGAPALQSIIERNDAVVRRAEGMEPQVSVLFGEAPAETEIEVAGLRLSLISCMRRRPASTWTSFRIMRASHVTLRDGACSIASRAREYLRWLAPERGRR